jgi:two-component system chemotaxis response regulator CheB
MFEVVHMPPSPFDLIVMAASLGGVGALRTVLAQVPDDFPAPIVIVQHISDRFPSRLTDTIQAKCRLPVCWITDGQRVGESGVFVAPAGFHTVIRNDRTFQFAHTARVNYVRPSADVLLGSAARVFGDRLLAVILTGAGRDGATGAVEVHGRGGRVLAQAPRTCVAVGMPAAAIRSRSVDLVLPLTSIGPALVSLAMVAGAAELLRVRTDPRAPYPNGISAADWTAASATLRSHARGLL